jgi:integrase
MPRKRGRRRSKGEGTIRKREITRKDGTTYIRYRAIITLGWDNDKQKQLEGPSRKTEREAREDLEAMRQERDTQGFNTQASASLGDYLDYWLEQRKPYLAPKSYRSYRDDINLYIKPRIGKKVLKKLTALDIQSWQTNLLNDTTPHITRRARAALGAALRQAIRWHILKVNLMDAIPPVKLPDVEHSRWSPAQAKKFFKVAEGHPFYTLYLLTLNTGLRMGEVRGLQWKNIQGNMLQVRQQVQGYASKAQFSPLKTRGSHRDIPLPSDVLFALAQHRQRQETLKEKAGHLWQDHDLVFSTGRGTPLGPDKIADAMAALCAKADVPKIRFHDLRHTNASLLIRQTDIRTVAGRLGHADSSITHRIYIHEIDALSKQFAPTMDELLGEDETTEEETGDTSAPTDEPETE